MSFTTTTDHLTSTVGPSGPRAGFWPRLAAAMIDGVLLAIVYLLIAGTVHLSGTLVVVVVGLAYFTFCEGGPRGQTIGKTAVHIRVVSRDTGQPIGYKRACGRDLARVVSAAPLYLGYFWMLWDPERQTWHDKLTGAVVVPEWPAPVK